MALDQRRRAWSSPGVPLDFLEVAVSRVRRHPELWCCGNLYLRGSAASGGNEAASTAGTWHGAPSRPVAVSGPRPASRAGRQQVRQPRARASLAHARDTVLSLVCNPICLSAPGEQVDGLGGDAVYPAAHAGG